MARLFKHLSNDNQLSIREYASDKIGVHPSAALIKTLDFQVNIEDASWKNPCTEVYAADMDYFITKDCARPGWFTDSRSRELSRSLKFDHNQYDERNFPQHFDIGLVWDKLLQNDEIESMGNEDTRSYPNGLPVSDTPHGWGWLQNRAD